MSSKFFNSWFRNRLSCKPDAQSFIVNINVAFSIEFHFILSRSVAHKDSVCMCIDKSRQNTVFRTINDSLKDLLVGVKLFDFLSLCNFFNDARCVDHDWDVVNWLNVIGVFEPNVRTFVIWDLQKLLNVLEKQSLFWELHFCSTKFYIVQKCH